MQDLFATRLEIATEEPDQAFASVAADVASWACRGDGDQPDFLAERQGRHEANGSTTTWRFYEVEDHPNAVIQVAMNHADETHAGLQWLSSIDIVRTSESVRVSMRIARLATEMRIAPATLDLHPPRLVTTLLRHHACTCGDGIPLAPVARSLQPGGVLNFVREVLTAPARRLPVVVLSPPPGRDSPEANPEQVARELAGLAHVYVLSGHLASERLTEALGAGRRVPRGGARMYWPGLGATGQSVRHPHWTRRALRHRPGRRPFSRFVFGMLAPLSVLRVPPDPAVWEVRATDARRRRRELEERTADEAIGDALEDLERVADLERELEAARHELEEKNELLLRHEENWATLGTGSPEEAGTDEVEGNGGEPLPPTSWDEVIELCEILEDSGAFVLTDNARAMLSPGGYPDPDRMYRHLEPLANAAEAYREAGGHVSQRFEDWAQLTFGIEVSLHDETLVRDGQDQFTHEGIEYSREPHVKVDDHVGADRCGRIYFALDPARDRLIVDHIGLHL